MGRVVGSAIYREVWGIQGSRPLARFPNELETLRLAQTLVRQYGDNYCADRELELEDNDSHVIETISGDSIIIRINAVIARSEQAVHK